MASWITNKGWEENTGNPSDFGDWVRSGSVAIHVLTTEPRTGTYSLRGSTGSGGLINSQVDFTIVDPVLLSYLAGKDVTFSFYRWVNSIAGGAGDNYLRVRVGDNVGFAGIDVDKSTPFQTWAQYSVTRTITAAPTSVYFRIRYYKASSASIYRYYIDDMEVEVANGGLGGLGVGVTGVNIYPTSAITRVTNLVHRYDRRAGVYQLEVSLGDVTSVYDQAYAPTGKRATVEKQQEADLVIRGGHIPAPPPPPPGPIVWGAPPLPTPPEPGLPSTPEVVTVPEPEVTIPDVESVPTVIELTDYAKEILETPAAEALRVRIEGIGQGVGAVITPYAIDVLRQNEEVASLLAQIQRLQKAASAHGITGYARTVLIKKLIVLKQRLRVLQKKS